MSEPSQPTPPSSPGAPGAPVPPIEPPAPPAPPVPPVPQYGEYAPAGYVPPQPAPGYEAAAAAAQPYGTQPYPAQPFGAASFPAQPGARRRKTWDLVLTVVLLVLGFFGMLIAFFYAGIFSDPTLMDQIAKGAGLPGFSGDVGSAGAVIVVSHLLLFLAAVGGALPLLLKKRVAFWVPLTAGVIAAIVFWGTFTAVFLTDPAFVSQYS